MPRQKRAPHLRLKKRHDGRDLWIIRDGARDIGTGCAREDRAGAEQALQAHRIEQWRPPQGQYHPAQLYVAEVLAAYREGRGPHTKRSDVIDYTCRSLARHWRGKKVADIRGQTCRDYVDARTDEGVSDQTARRDLESLRAALKWFHTEYGFDGQSPPAVPLPAKAPPRNRWLEREEVARLLWACDKKQHAHARRFILLGIYTGTRPGAILRLHWGPSPVGGDVDLEADVIHRRARGTADDPRKRQPPQRIQTRLRPHLERWCCADRQQGINRLIHWHGDAVQKLRNSWKTIRRRAELDDDVVPHTLRHTAATWLMQAGVPIFEAAGYLGMTPEMLTKVYGHHHPDFQTSAATADFRRLGRQIGTKPGREIKA